MSQLLTKPRFVFDEAKHCYWLEGDEGKTPLIGTTTALSVMDKSGLTYWASGMACAEFGWLNPKKNPSQACQEAARTGLERIRAMSLGEYMVHLDKAYKAHNVKKNESKDSGVEMHSLLEEFIKCRMTGGEPLFIDPKIAAFKEWADKNVRRFLFTEMCCYSKVLHCAGTADFGYEDMAGEWVLGDFKSSESAYYSMYLQCGAYDLQISENGGYTPRGDKVFTLSQPFSRYEIFAFRAGMDKPFVTTEMARLKRAFAYCINLYREKIWWEEAIDKKESGLNTWRNK